MKIKRLVVLILCGAFLAALFGCGNKDRHILDGPGMERNTAWDAFTVSRTDSNSLYIFWFTVEQTETAYMLTGECRDEDGCAYTVTEGMELSAEDAIYVQNLCVADRQDILPDDGFGGEELILMDAPDFSLILHCTDGSDCKKAITSDETIEMYNRFLPYFKNN